MAARITYFDDSEPGITRKKVRNGWGYWDAADKRITDREEIDRLNAIGLPPAYVRAWFCPSPNGHIQAVGWDERGRKQYRYHLDFRSKQDHAKYDLCAPFGRALPKLREKVASDLRRRSHGKNTAVAAIVRLLDIGHVRVGNESYVKENKSYGATTLRKRHAEVRGNTLKLQYKAKSGKLRMLTITDGSLARFVKKCQDLPGQHLFRWVDAAGESHPVTSSDVNDYIREAMGDDYTAKHFRTWGASTLAFAALTEAEHDISLKTLLLPVTEALGNTPAIARKSYVHPALIALVKEGQAKFRAALALPRASRHLSRAERGLIAFLEAGVRKPRRKGRIRRDDMSNNAAAVAAAKAPVFDAGQFRDQLNGLTTSTIAWLHSHWLQILIGTAIGVVIVIILHAARQLGARLATRSKSGKGWPAIIGNTILKTNNFFIVMLAAKLVQGYAGAPEQVTTTISFLFTIATVFQAAIWVRELILGGIEHRTRDEHYNGEAIGSAMGIIRLLVSFAVFAIALIVVLDNLGVNVTGLVAGLGVGGIAIGLAAQGIFADLFAALAIIFDKPFHRGDTIGYDTTVGTVEAIGLKSTRIRSATGEERIISNKNLLDKEIQNITRREYRRVIFVLGLVQWTSIETMQALPAMLKEIVEGCGRKFIRAGFVKFNDSSYDFDVEFDSPTNAFADFFDARHSVGLAIIKRLNDEGIELAYPTQTAFTAAPEGGMILPYAEAKPLAKEARPATDVDAVPPEPTADWPEGKRENQ